MAGDKLSGHLFDDYNDVRKEILMVLRRGVIACVLAVLFILFAFGCSKKQDADVETKPVEQVQKQVQTKAESINTEELMALAVKSSKKLEAQRKEAAELVNKLQNSPTGQITDEQAKVIIERLGELKKSMDSLKEEFDVYYKKLKDSGTDVSALE